MYITYLSIDLSISIYIYIDGLKLRMSRSFPFFFTQKIEPDPFRGVLGAT